MALLPKAHLRVSLFFYFSTVHLYHIDSDGHLISCQETCQRKHFYGKRDKITDLRRKKVKLTKVIFFYSDS